MILVFMRDGNCVEVENAAGADMRRDLFVCFDAEGREVANFPLKDVQSYTLNDEMTRFLEDEACDEVTLVPADPDDLTLLGRP